jgi:hypothetical protein
MPLICGLAVEALYMYFAMCRCVCEYKDAVKRSRSCQRGVPAVMEAQTTSKVDVVKYFESCIINFTLKNVNAFFIADKRGECVCMYI